MFGTIEHARITEDEGFLGSGPGVAGGVQWHLTRTTSIAIETGWQRHVRDFDRMTVAFDAQGRPRPLPFTERWEGTTRSFLGLAAKAFGASRAQPLVWGGAGYQWHGGTLVRPLTRPVVPPGLTLQPGDAESRRGNASSAGVVDGGFGVAIRLTNRSTVRPFVGVRVAVTDTIGPMYILRTGARVGLRF